MYGVEVMDTFNLRERSGTDVIIAVVQQCRLRASAWWYGLVLRKDKYVYIKNVSSVKWKV